MNKINLSNENNNKIEEETYNFTVWAVEEEMRKNDEVVELRAKVAENNKTFFDKKKEVAFQDDYGQDGVMYNENYYKDYQDVLNNYEIKYIELNNEKNAIKSKIGFGKKKKLEEVNRKIDSLNEKMDIYCKIRNREELFEKNWFKDGKFVDLNKDYNARLNEIKNQYTKESVKNLFDKNPEYINYDFSKSNLPLNVIAEITKYQKSLNISVNNKDSKEKKNLENKIDPEREM